jgi:hypothetical protein
MDNRVINHCKGGETYNPKTNGKKSWFRQEWFKCGMGWFFLAVPLLLNLNYISIFYEVISASRSAENLATSC